MLRGHGPLRDGIQLVKEYVSAQPIFIRRLLLFYAGRRCIAEGSVPAAIHSLLVGNSTLKDPESADSWLTNTEQNASFFYGSICFSQYRPLLEKLLRILAYTRTVILSQPLMGIRAEALSE